MLYGKKMIDSRILLDFCKNTTNYFYQNKDNHQSILTSGNETRSSDKQGKYSIITFADKDVKRIYNAKRLQDKIKKYELIDEFRVFSLSDIPDHFIDANKSIFDSRIFPWISKVYLFYNFLKTSNDHDCVLWIDSDVVDLQENGIETIFNICNNSNNGLVGFHNNFWMERSFTKADLFKYFNISHNHIARYTNQAYGGIFIAKVNKFTLNFFKEWLDICTIHSMIDNSKSKNSESVDFITHKNDQSILSLLYKKYNIKTFPLPLHDCDRTDIIALHSGYFNNGITLPLVWESCWHNISIQQMWQNCNKKYGKKVVPDNCLSASLNYFNS